MVALQTPQGKVAVVIRTGDEFLTSFADHRTMQAGMKSTDSAGLERLRQQGHLVLVIKIGADGTTVDFSDPENDVPYPTVPRRRLKRRKRR